MAEFRFSQKGSIRYLESTVLAGCGFLDHAFCTRRGGVSLDNFSSLNFCAQTGDDPEKVRANGELLAEAFRVPPRQFLVVNQVHGDRILTIDRSDYEIPFCGDFPAEADLSCDAMVTDQPGLAICIKTADCVPIFLVDKVQRVIGAVHAGWRGTALNIAGKTIDRFVERFASRTSDILAVIGPAIGPCCYEVDSSVFLSLSSVQSRASIFGAGTRKGRWMLDLPAANRWQIEERGIPGENIFPAGICTSCRRDDFFSHRRDRGETGRHLNFLMVR